ncbi:MAG: CCA tRNA nucleotidyltransferase [Cyanobacteriota bacterium]|nr:CCA tRNA nucleotidyltransferase [Cyanobacteriota bacterium]
MPPDPTSAAILARDPSSHQRLWEALAPETWPLPLPLLPPGTALVGGAVRDGCLGRLGERPDLDFVVPDDGLALTRQLADRLGGTAVELDRERSIGRLVLGGWTMDLARQQGNLLSVDLGRRDFALNAIALCLPIGDQPLRLVDPLGGLADLQRGQIRAIAEANLLEDPIRLMRGVRLAAELEFTLTPQSWDWIVLHRATLAGVAGERVLAELQRLVSCPDGARGVDLLQRSGLLAGWMAAPDAEHPPPPTTTHLTLEEARRRGLTEEEAAAALPIARLAALLDEECLRRLHASNKLRQRCRQLRRWRQRLVERDLRGRGFEALPEAEQLELHRQVNGDIPALVLELAPPLAAAALQRWHDPEDPLFHPRPPMDGRILQQLLGLPPGPWLGQLLDHLTAERAFGRLPRHAGSDPQTWEAARNWIATRGGLRHD